jgi:hypothetical protein
MACPVTLGKTKGWTGLEGKCRTQERRQRFPAKPVHTCSAVVRAGVTFVSLQKGQGEEEAVMPPTGQSIANMESGIQDFADTAAIVAQLYLVIYIDTVIAHLAGALSKPS